MSDEQVGELRYIEELEAEVERQRIALSAAGMEKNALLAEKMAENEKLRGEKRLLESAYDQLDGIRGRAERAEAEVETLQRSTVHALYQGQKKRAEAAEAKLAEVEKEADAVIDSWRTQCIDTGERLAEVEKDRVADLDRLAGALREIVEMAPKLPDGASRWTGFGVAAIQTARDALASLEADQSKETV